MSERETASNEKTVGRWPRYEAAALGFRNYWYPVLESRKLRAKRPQPITVCGEKVVLVRDGTGVHGLSDRCPHRGVPLSMGRCEFAGTVSCSYHGWTYDLESGELVAALTDGPDSPICGKASVRVKTYPVEERANLIWVYIGDEPRPPVEEDIPEELQLPDAVVEPMVDLRKGDWRYGMENAVDEAHAKFLHRKTPYYFFREFPAYQTDIRMVASEDGKWLERLSKPVFGPAQYGKLGTWPKRDLWRSSAIMYKPEDNGKRPPAMFKARLPAIFYIGHGDWLDFQMFVPVDPDRHLTLQVTMSRAKGLGKLFWKFRYWAFIRYFHHIVLNRWEDGAIIEAMDSPPERLFRPDISIAAWRRWCDFHARRSPTDRAVPPESEDTADMSEDLPAV